MKNTIEAQCIEHIYRMLSLYFSDVFYLSKNINTGESVSIFVITFLTVSPWKICLLNCYLSVLDNGLITHVATELGRNLSLRSGRI